ncbi:glycosyltransferase 87 family protein [Neorhizobium sp. T6_25]|uniref:glycosyltransferase 87 family protein n=1 Tax=Neorhizobium sp. T6_25 TaxID=2093833 RepID=UPI000CF8A200|nr:glycosyltransferase 87 family protein [Neorhizobium sp. T6_25]
MVCATFLLTISPAISTRYGRQRIGESTAGKHEQQTAFPLSSEQADEEQDEGPGVAGIMIGLLISIKPNFAVWPVLLFLAGHRTPSVVAIVTAVVIAAVPLLIFVSGIYLDWLHLVATDGGRAVFLRKRVVCRTCSAGGPPGRGHRSCSRIIAFAGSVGFFSAGRQ